MKKYRILFIVIILILLNLQFRVYATDEAERLFEEGLKYYQLAKNEEAIDSFDKAIKNKPEYTIAWTYKGLALHKLKKYEEAIDCFDKAIKLEPEFTLALVGKGIVLKLNNTPRIVARKSARA